MPRAKAKVEQSLQAKGFQGREGDHHFYVYHRLDGRKSAVFTKTSHTPRMRDLPDVLLGKRARQCRLNRKQFLDLVDCPMSREAYEAAVFPEPSISA